MYEIVIVLIVLAILFTLVVLSFKLIKSQASDLLMRGLSSTDSLERNTYLRKAALLCNREALLAYTCNNPDMFVKPKMQPFKFHNGLRHFPCVFADHYFAKGLMKYISKEQKTFMKRVYAFDGLQEDCDDLIEEAIKKLPVCTDEVVIMFMPCSNDIRFMNKFQHLSWKLKKKGYDANHLTYPTHSIRDQRKIFPTEGLMAHVGIMHGVEKRKVIVVDDVYNTGETLKAFVKELKKNKSQIVGAVFISKVFNPPKDMFITWLKILFCRV